MDEYDLYDVYDKSGCFCYRSVQMFLSPGARGELGDLPVGGVGEFLERVSQIGVGIDVVASAGFHDGVEDGAVVSGIGISKKEVVLFSNCSGADGVFDEVVVYFDTSVVEVDGEEFPVG